MIEADFAYAFTLGMVAAVNPCGFALLPAYLSYFLGLEGAPADARAGVARSLSVGLAVTAGFMVVFGVVGIGITQLGLSVSRHLSWLPWATMVIGAAIAVLGVAMLRGFQPALKLPRLQMGGSGRELPSMFLFGISYATVSLSCTLPLFLPVMTRTLGSSSFGSGLAGILTYAAGMGLVLCALTVALGGARRGLVTRLRGIQPHINRISGGLLVLAGTYVAYYGYWERRVISDPLNPPPSGVVNRVTDMSAQVTNWVSNVGATRIGIVLLAAVVIAVILALGARRPSPAEDQEHSPV